MGAPSQQQIDECVADGLARGTSENEILAEASELERLDDHGLAALGVFPPSLPAAQAVTAGSDRPDRQNRPDRHESPSFVPAPSRRGRAGWTAERQRAFIEMLAESGSVNDACAVVGLSPRSAYKLRHRPGAEDFNEAWVHAETLAATRLTALAFDRAIHGRSEYLFKDGVLVAERRMPSDRLLMWLISHLDPAGFGHLARRFADNPRYRAADRLPDLLAAFADVAEADCPTEIAEFEELGENTPLSRT